MTRRSGKGFPLAEPIAAAAITGIPAVIAVPGHAACMDCGHKTADPAEPDALRTAAHATTGEAEIEIAAVRVDMDPDTGAIRVIMSDTGDTRDCFFCIDSHGQDMTPEHELGQQSSRLSREAAGIPVSGSGGNIMKNRI